MFKSLSNLALNFGARLYKNILGARLRSNGLKYEDLLVEGSDLSKALSRSSNVVQVERARRIKRAFDASVKRKTIAEEAQNYEPFEFQLSGKLEQAHLERTERALLNA